VKGAAARRILIIRLRYLGDTFLLRPVLRAISGARPGVPIDAIVARGTAVALEGMPGLARVIEWPAGLGAQASLVARVAAAGYEFVLDLTGNDRSALLTRMSRARVRAGFFKPRQPWWYWRNHACNLTVTLPHPKPPILEQHALLLEAAGIPRFRGAFPIALPEGAVIEARRIAPRVPGARRLHVHAVSRDMQKAYPVDLVREVIRRLPDDVRVVVTHGSSEVETAHARACADGIGNVQVVSGVAWWTLAALIADADAYWGCDTAPMHAAAALGVPMLVAFGPSPAHQWRPASERAVVDVRECACLAERMVTCAKGAPGRCLAGMDPGAVAEQLRALLDA
jgi:heptosyltransferase-3